MNCYGRDMLLCRSGEAEVRVRGFFQPDTGRKDRLVNNQPGPLGLENRMRFVYYGPVEYPLDNGDVVMVDGKAYLVRSTQILASGDAPVYCWGLCVEKGGEDNWGQS